MTERLIEFVDPRTRGLVSSAELRLLLAAFRTSLQVTPGLEPHLGGLVEDVLAHPGSLLRARLAFAIARRFGVAESAATSLGVAIEYFHTASLVLDDLPAMDDAESRRGRPCPHGVFGESAAILGSLALINRAYGLLWQVLGELPSESRQGAAKLVDACLGLAGILDGQARDLHFRDEVDLDGDGDSRDGDSRDGDSRRRVLSVAEGKTVTLIRLTLQLPALAAGVGEAELRLLDRVARAWGLAYQVLDDFKDGLMSDCETGKTSHRDRALGRPNLPAVEGNAAAWQRLENLLAEGRDLLVQLAARDARWGLLETVQEILDEEREALAPRVREVA